MRGIFDDTIAAIATPPGRGAVALVRVSGPAAAALLLRICPTLKGELPRPREPRLLAVVHPERGERLDHALVTYFPGPASYTGEDTVELSTHGGMLTPQLVLDALLAAGARQAERGEFTRRALFNGKLDLLQAEAIGDLIDGHSPALHRVAVHQMERGLSRRVEELRREVIRLEGMVAYSIDFPEEDEPPVPPEQIDTAAVAVMERLEALVRTVPHGELLRSGAMLVLAGRPNSGKSSLFNALLGLERAIVTEIPGTTRDALEAELTLEGYPFRLVDTAGLRPAADRVEAIGIEVARRYLEAAQLVLFCVPAGREIDSEEQGFLASMPEERRLLVRTMSDLLGREAEDGNGESSGSVAVSVITGEGLDALRREVVTRVFAGLQELDGEVPLVTRERHARALRGALEELSAFRKAMRDGVPMELAATHLGTAALRLEELIGVVTPDDVLAEVFGSFCVGK
ncbi:MAG TPA: tRNA uridine-5-carboxymethylaminomethyl(34) synthesis GTPase MnmE [Longimicrobiaceae bacterium]